MRVVGALLVAVAWAAVLRGLFLLPASADPGRDLEAGPAFAENVAVYLPAAALTVVVPCALAAAVRLRNGQAAGAAAAVMVGGFGLWVLTRSALLGYLPGLGSTVWVAIGLAVAGLAAFGVDLVQHPARSEQVAG